MGRAKWWGKMTKLEESQKEEFEQFKATVRKEAVEQAAKWAIGAVIVMMGAAITGWWLYLKPMIAASFGGVPENAILAFDEPSACAKLGPYWEDFKDGAGRDLLSGQERVVH